MIVVTYEALSRDPAATLVYDFLGEAQFRLDFDNVEDSADAFDEGWGLRARTPCAVEFVDRPTTCRRSSSPHTRRLFLDEGRTQRPRNIEMICNQALPSALVLGIADSRVSL
jgi:hypothetical protein